MQFLNRREAGRALAQRLAHYTDHPDVIVLGLPRGGVPVAYEVALALHAPLDIILVRKLGVPWREELALGAIASGGVRVLNEDVVETLNISDRVIDTVTAKEMQELERREHAYRGDRPPLVVQHKVVIVVDDGLATGSTMRAAVAALKQQEPARLVVAVPTAARETAEEFATEVDEVVCVITPEPFHAVGLWYFDFAPTSDDEVRELLAQPSSV